MDENWEVIFRCAAPYKAEIVKAILEENEIEAVIINKKDSSYLFGDVEVYVRREDVMNAKQMVNRFEADE